MNLSPRIEFDSASLCVCPTTLVALLASCKGRFKLASASVAMIIHIPACGFDWRGQPKSLERLNPFARAGTWADL